MKLLTQPLGEWKWVSSSVSSPSLLFADEFIDMSGAQKERRFPIKVLQDLLSTDEMQLQSWVYGRKTYDYFTLLYAYTRYT